MSVPRALQAASLFLSPTTPCFPLRRCTPWCCEALTDECGCSVTRLWDGRRRGQPQLHPILVAALHETRLWLRGPCVKPPVSLWTTRKPKQLRENVPQAEHFQWWSELLHYYPFYIILVQTSPSSEPNSPTGMLVSSFYPAALLEGDRKDCSCGHCPGQGFLLSTSSSATWGGQRGSPGVSLPGGGYVILDEG